MTVTASDIKVLREATGLSMVQCKKALEASGGDQEKALEALKAEAGAIAAKKGERGLGAGTIAAYVHNNAQVAGVVELQSETDFVAKNEEFVALAKNIAMHVCAMAPESKEELMSQSYMLDETKTIEAMVQEAVQKFGENIAVGRFDRYQVLA